MLQRIISIKAVGRFRNCGAAGEVPALHADLRGKRPQQDDPLRDPSLALYQLARARFGAGDPRTPCHLCVGHTREAAPTGRLRSMNSSARGQCSRSGRNEGLCSGPMDRHRRNTNAPPGP